MCAPRSAWSEVDVESYYPVAIVTLLAGLLCFGMSLAVSRAHGKTGILAPTMTGDPLLERSVRAHTNTLEWTPIFLPAMWLFAVYWSPAWAAGLGVVWIVGRIVYFLGYRVAPQKRVPGFFIQSTAVFALSLGALGRIVYLMATRP
jgi:glutathione S-transferase